MAECLLPGLDPYDSGRDREGIVWDTGIPGDCQNCLRRALADSSVKKVIEYPAVNTSDFTEGTERFSDIGIRAMGDQGQRQGVEENGYGDSGFDGVIDVRTTCDFVCYGANESLRYLGYVPAQPTD